jgi:hypothetical protein
MTRLIRVSRVRYAARRSFATVESDAWRRDFTGRAAIQIASRHSQPMRLLWKSLARRYQFTRERCGTPLWFARAIELLHETLPENFTVEQIANVV